MENRKCPFCHNEMVVTNDYECKNCEINFTQEEMNTIA